MGAAGMGLQVAGMFSSANAAKANAESTQINLQYKSDMAKLNAQLSESNAQATLLASERQVQGIKLRTAQVKSSQRASMAANGIDLGSDSAVNILTSTDVMGEIDANTAYANGVRSAWGYRTQAQNFTGEAAMASASASGINPGTAYSTTLIGGAGSVATSWYKLNKGYGLNPFGGN